MHRSILLICLANVAFGCTNTTSVTKSPDNSNDSTVITNTITDSVNNQKKEDLMSRDYKKNLYNYTIDGNKVILYEEEKIDHAPYEPLFRNRKIMVNDKTVIHIEQLHSKSELLSPAFHFSIDKPSLVKKTGSTSVIEVLLFQAECSGSFCSDCVIITITLSSDKKSVHYTVTDDYRGE